MFKYNQLRHKAALERPGLSAKGDRDEENWRKKLQEEPRLKSGTHPPLVYPERKVEQ